MSTNDTTTTDTTLSANSTPLLTVITDQPDYSPGMVATFTASNAGVGDTLEFTVAHVEAGADGIIGTADDVLAYDISGTGTTSTVTDGGAGDLDGIANGVIVTNWAVNQDAFGQTFLLTAFDETTGTFATTTFTDAKLSQANFTYTDQTSTVFDITSPVQAPNGEINFNNGALGETTPFGNVSGSGNFQPFVRISTNIGQEEGYNSTAQATETIKFGGATVADDLVVNGVGTPIITLASLGDIVVGPTAQRYYEFTLDANQNNKALISLDEVQIYQSSLSTLGTTAALQYDPDATLGGTGTGFGANATLVYNLDSLAAASLGAAISRSGSTPTHRAAAGRILRCWSIRVSSTRPRAPTSTSSRRLAVIREPRRTAARMARTTPALRSGRPMSAPRSARPASGSSRRRRLPTRMTMTATSTPRAMWFTTRLR